MSAPTPPIEQTKGKRKPKGASRTSATKAETHAAMVLVRAEYAAMAGDNGRTCSACGGPVPADRTGGKADAYAATAYGPDGQKLPEPSILHPGCFAPSVRKARSKHEASL